MSQALDFYELSQEADHDLEDILDYTEKEYGLEKAIAYVMQFESLFELLRNNPAIGKQRDEIKIGLRSIPKAEHVVFYRIFSNHIRIVRVLHGKRDIGARLF